MYKNTKNPLFDLLKNVFPIILVMYVISIGVTFFFGLRIDWIIGLTIGFIYLILSNIYLARVMNSAIDRPEKSAKRLMTSCYLIRYIFLLGLGVIAYFAGFINIFAIFIPQFYLRIALLINNFFEKRGNRK